MNRSAATIDALAERLTFDMKLTPLFLTETFFTAKARQFLSSLCASAVKSLVLA
jgi:hypothetical protein